jgi:D-aspartate ligase
MVFCLMVEHIFIRLSSILVNDILTMKKTCVQRPPVFIVDFSSHGYGLARALAREGIEVVAFLPPGQFFVARSIIPSKIVRISDSDDATIHVLEEEAQCFSPLKPVLVFNSDTYQGFISKFYDRLMEVFTFEIPRYDELKHFLEKDLFNALALKHNIKIPRSYEVTLNDYDVLIAGNAIAFPLIVKPKYRDALWDVHFPHDKVFVASNHEELMDVCERLLRLVSLLVVQEWIPGNDSSIYYCLAYVTRQGEVLDYYCGQKVHQYPILLGNTSSSIPCNDPYVIQEALRIFALPGIYGFCSVEFKKDCHTGEYYVIEPTVGRINRQELSALSCKSNLVIKAYYHLTGLPYVERPICNKSTFFIEEYVEVKSCFEHSQHHGFNFWAYVKLLFTNKVVFQVMNWRDPLVSLRMLIAIVKLIFTETFLLLFKPSSRKPSPSIAKLYKTFTSIEDK